MAFYSSDAPPEAHGRAFGLVQDYIVKCNLKKMGYTLDPKELSEFEIQYLMFCQSCFSKLEDEKMKNAQNK